ncbi:SLAM family member 5-like [Siphateles boraxobius]|uniref:SLAM family member 5-like n=1 Tax=Siphateles boraxobius TaxID=180520 RepID=UPI0040644EB0
MFCTFAFCCLCCCLIGVFADELKSVKEGDSVTLNSSLTEIQKDEEILWTFGTNGILIAKTNGVNNTIYDVADGRFRDRLKLDNKTGSLIIVNIRTEHAGVYEVEISDISSQTKHRFNVTVCALTRLVVSVLVGVAAACIVVYDITSRKVDQERT